MVSNCLTDDVTLKFPLYLPFSFPLSLFLSIRWIKQPALFNDHKASAVEMKDTDSKAALSY